MANNIAPGLKRIFAFHAWPWMEHGIIEKAYVEARAASISATVNATGHEPADNAPAPVHAVATATTPTNSESPCGKPRIYGFDIDPAVLRIAKANAARAGFENINLKRADFNDLDFSKFENCTFVCNPPYGERAEGMGDHSDSHLGRHYGEVSLGRSNCDGRLCERSEAGEASRFEVVREMYKSLGKKFAQTKNCSLYIITSHQDFPRLFGRKEDKNRKLFNGNLRCYLFSYFSFHVSRK